ncbi:alpha-ribazole phosphatase [Clostridium ihumii]|uniref:alpha-ribazole phosphatase n=1 Tax=Clostridium ihumii TaxID=1470356 RepID=UPI00058F366A|nr:alpha-ribazole phosphatase [Clostridium ihumii]
MNIYLVRHGETDENIKKSFYGDMDSVLTEKGVLQCKRLKIFFQDINISKAYVSEKKRTHDTLELILENEKYEKINVVEDSRLNERNFGEFEGLDYNSICRKYPLESKVWQNDWINFIPPKGESYNQMYNRVVKIFKEIIKSNDENVIVVTHSGVIRSIYCYIMNNNMDLFWKFACHNGDVAVIKYEYENLFIEGINSNSILK